MTARSVTPVALLFAALAANAFFWAPDRALTSGAEGRPTTFASTRSAAPSLDDPTPDPAQAPALPATTASALTAPATLRADSAAALAEQATLRQLAHGRDLRLTDAQWAELAAAVARHQAIRQAHEASIATVAPLPGGRYRVEVPAYVEVGEMLRAHLVAEMEQRLGPAAADAVAAELEDALEGYFAGFGVSVQTLEFDLTADRATTDSFVTRTVVYSNASRLDEPPATRREVHLPAAEDPTGVRWQPFFALIGRR